MTGHYHVRTSPLGHPETESNGRVYHNGSGGIMMSGDSRLAFIVGLTVVLLVVVAGTIASHLLAHASLQKAALGPAADDHGLSVTVDVRPVLDGQLARAEITYVEYDALSTQLRV